MGKLRRRSLIEGVAYDRNLRHRWEDNIKMDLQEVGRRGRGDWMDLAQDRDR
jgi:hypothetical protein